MATTAEHANVERAVNVSHTDGEGRVTEFWAFPENSQELDEFFS